MAMRLVFWKVLVSTTLSTATWLVAMPKRLLTRQVNWLPEPESETLLVVAGRFGQRAARVRIDGQHGVEIAAEGIHGDEAVGRRGVLVPDGAAGGGSTTGGWIACGSRNGCGLGVGVTGGGDDNGSAAL